MIGDIRWLGSNQVGRGLGDDGLTLAVPGDLGGMTKLVLASCKSRGYQVYCS